MLLRDHPLMSRNGLRNWPPVWLWVDGSNKFKFPKGEVGILRFAVAFTGLQPSDRCYLIIDHEGSSFMGCLLFDDHSFCHHVAELLEDCRNRPIVEIGSLDVSDVETRDKKIPQELYRLGRELEILEKLESP